MASRQLALFLGAVLLIGSALILAFEHYERDIVGWLEDNFTWLASNPLVVLCALALMVSPILALAVYLFRSASRGIKQQRMPPAGHAVARGAPVVEGASAVRRGRVVQVLSVLLFSAASAVPVLAWYLFSTLTQGTS